MTTDSFAERAAQWDQNPERLAAARAFLDAVKPLAGQRLAGRVLDFGAGTGLIGLPLAAKASRVDLMDSSPGMVDVLRAKIAAQGLTNVQTLLGELDALDLPPGTYDVIVTNNALHHVEHVPPLLGLMAALLAPGGALFIGDVATEDGSFHAPNRVPHNGFAPEDLAALLEGAGLRVAAPLFHHVIRKRCHDEVVRDFPQLLICAEKA